MSFIIGDEIITEEIPEEVEAILNRLKERTREKSRELMNTLSNSERFMAYIIPNAGMVLFADELKDDRKVFRYLISNSGELSIDNKQKGGDMFCPLFDTMEKEIGRLTQKEVQTIAYDREYKVYESFMPKIVETINQVLTTEPEIFKA